MAGLRGGLYRQQNIPFPRQLQNTAVSPQLVGLDFAREIINMIPSTGKAGSGAKRFGTAILGNTTPNGNITSIMSNINNLGGVDVLVGTSTGYIYLLDESTGNYTELKSGLSTDGTIRWCNFDDKLVIVNGVDANMYWDGTTLAEMEELVTDLGINPTWVDDNTFTIEPSTGVEDANYPAGRIIRVEFATAGFVTATVDTTTYDAGTNTLTVNVTGNPFPAVSEVINDVEYTDSPPPFSFIFPQHDRLWALGPRVLKAREFPTQDRMTVYYTNFTNNVNGWFNETTAQPAFINISDKHQVADTLEAIAAIDGQMLFIGRERTQVWTGTDPTLVSGDIFAWGKTVKLGAVHGDLVAQYPRDVLMFTEYGARSFRTIFQTEGLEVTTDLGTSVDPTIQNQVKELLSSDEKYRKARSFVYTRDGFYGFKVTDAPLIYELSEEARGWSNFTGLFESASAYLALPDGRLVLGSANQLYVYTNDADGNGVGYSDNGSSIFTSWWTPWIETGRRWANKYFEFIMEPNIPSIDLTYTRYMDNDINTNRSKSVTIDTQTNLWDIALWDVANWDTGKSSRQRVRDKFLANSYSLRITTNDTKGPFEIVGVKAYGG